MKVLRINTIKFSGKRDQGSGFRIAGEAVGLPCIQSPLLNPEPRTLIPFLEP